MTLLLSGKVLFTRQSDSSGPPSAELYDPMTGTWSATGTLTVVHWGFSTTVLPSGKVLAAGGSNGSSYVSSAELYDPVSGTWSTTGSMIDPRGGHTATLLPNGKVLVVGGRQSSSYAYGIARAELYDPATGTWSATGSLATARTDAVTTLLPSGKFLMAGGGNSAGNGCLSTAELYDPSTGTWSGTGSLGTIRCFASAVLLPSGKVLVAGGFEGSIKLASTEVYDPVAGTWSAGGTMARERTWFPMTLLHSGKVLVSGGSAYGGDLASTEVYDPASGSWTVTGPQVTARSHHTATLLPNGRVLVAGGQFPAGVLADAELYDPAVGSWIATGALANGRARHTATPLPTGDVLVVGGDGPTGPIASAELYSAAAGTWTATGSLATGRSGHTATLLDNGKVLVAGGGGAAGALAVAELYAPAVGVWSSTGAMATARAHHAATLLPGGKVLVTGGQSSGVPLASAELYDPVLGLWAGTGSLGEARADHTATLLPRGWVLVAGGGGATGPLASAELYSPATGTWTLMEALTTARARHTATLLPDGRVLVSAGSGATGRLGSAELYDPAVGAWSATASLTSSRADASATLLPSGKVLVAGGSIGTGSLASVELYEATCAGDAWRPVIAPLGPVQAGTLLDVTGSGFRGIHGTSSTFLIVRLQAIEGEGITPVLWEAFSSTTATVRVPSLRDGHYLLTVTAAALRGGTVVFIDGPPAAPVLTAPASVVRPATFTVAGSAEAGSTVTVLLDGAPLGSVAVNATGEWDLVPALTLGDGPYTVTATSTDAAGNISSASLSRSFIVDSQPPAMPAVLVPANLAMLKTTTPALSGTAESGSTVTVLLDGAVAGTAAASGAGSWSFTPGTALGQGLHTVAAQATDAAGNISVASASRSFTVDTIAPGAPGVTEPASGAVVGSTPVIAGTAEAGSRVSVFLDDTPAGTATASAAGSWNFRSGTFPLRNGPHTLVARATDPLGNTSVASSPRAFTVDLIAPGAPVVDAPANGGFVNTALPTFSGTAEPGSTVTVFIDAAKAGTAPVDEAGTWSFTPTTALGEGVHRVSVAAADAVGNTSMVFSLSSFTVDLVAPPAPQVVAPADGASVKTAPLITGTAEAGSEVTVFVDGAAVGGVPVDGTGAWSFVPSILLGAHSVTARTTDLAGNVGLFADVIHFTLVQKSYYDDTGCSAMPSEGLGILTLLALVLPGVKRACGRGRRRSLPARRLLPLLGLSLGCAPPEGLDVRWPWEAGAPEVTVGRRVEWQAKTSWQDGGGGLRAEALRPAPPLRAPAVEAWRQAEGEESAVGLARAYFPEFSGGVEPGRQKAPINPATALRVKLPAAAGAGCG